MGAYIEHERARSRAKDAALPAVSPKLGTDEGYLLELHPTIKPVTLVADAILDCSARGDIVLDSFLGSGTSVIAAERTGRRCCGLEQILQFVEIAWQIIG
jgi:DNA modification methylase